MWQVYVCLVLVLVNTSSIDSCNCAPGWKQNGQFCYKLVTNPQLDRYAADKFCISLNSVLAQPESKEENDHIQNMIQALPQSIFIGLLLEPNVTVQHTIDVSDTFTYFNFKPSVLTATPLINRCTRFNDKGLWTLGRCEVPRSFICKQEIRRNPKPVRCVAIAPNGTAVPSETHLHVQGDQIWEPTCHPVLLWLPLRLEMLLV